MIWERFILYVLCPLFYPILNFLLPLVSKKIAIRRDFEFRNFSDPAARSFKSVGVVADIAFEVSSVGELEQVLPIVRYAIKKDMRIELIYCSQSVERGCQKIYSDNPRNVRLLRLPLITFFPIKIGQNISSWMTAKTFILCRYDFFPEILLYGSREDVFFILVSATLKNKKFLFGLKRIYSLFDVIITATENDLEQINHLIDRVGNKKKILTYDFRIAQIGERLESVDIVLDKDNLRDHLFSLKDFDYQRAIIFGSFWACEAEVFSNEDFLKDIWAKKITVVLAPHELNRDNLARIKKSCEQFSGGRLKVYIIGPDSINPLKGFEQNPGPIIITYKGILCELYSKFKFAFVGGGHGRSIHSVLEPYLAKCIVFCGPKIHRSTEFDFIMDKSKDFIRVVDNLNKFYPTVKGYFAKEADKKARIELIKDSQKCLDQLFNILADGVKKNVK